MFRARELEITGPIRELEIAVDIVWNNERHHFVSCLVFQGAGSTLTGRLFYLTAFHVQRLYHRYCDARGACPRFWNALRRGRPSEEVCNCCNVMDKEKSSREAAPVCACPVQMLGENDARFLLLVRDLVLRKGCLCGDNALYSVSPELYSVWSLTSSVSFELLADALNESGCLKFFSSADKEDAVFGACGQLKEVEARVLGAAARTPF